MQVASRACPAMVAQLRCAAAASPTAATATSKYFLASLLHSSSPPLGQAAKTKSALAKLRKKTGYSLSLCKQALEANEQDVAMAQEWLKDQALKQGWAKANKLEGRNAAQGLVGLLVRDGVASMVEVNSETDFVARNAQFHDLLREVTTANLRAAKTSADQESGSVSRRRELGQQEMSSLQDAKGRSLADVLALNIGQIGENLVARRGVCLSGARVAGVTHPSASIHSKEVQYGRYGAAMAYTVEEGGVMPEGQDINSMARQLCQHIIGMNPTRVGDLGTFGPADEGNVAAAAKEEEQESKAPSSGDEDEKTLEEREDEATREADRKAALASHEELVRQDFLLNPEVKVGRVLLDTGIRVVDFVRYEVGQDQE